MKFRLMCKDERSKSNRCWFCRTNQSVKYVAQIVNTNPTASNRYMNIIICNRCALNHMNDLIDMDT